jgi:hypothetical protein
LAILAITAILAISSGSGDVDNPGEMHSICLLLDNSFAYTHPPSRCFVANKGPSAIRQDCHKAVEALFPPLFDLESRSFFLLTENANFTL